MVKKYPIGTRIRFINSMLDTNKTGRIVGFWSRSGKPVVYLPAAEKHIEHGYFPTLSDGTKFTWKCGWAEIELIAQKNEQLLFDFAYEK